MKSRAIQKNNHPSAGGSPPIGDVDRALRESRRVLVISHTDPDGDALGTQLAFAAYLEYLGKDVFMVRETEVPPRYTFLPGVDEIAHIDSCPDDLTVDTAVVLECPSMARVGRAARFIGDNVTVINIDHHTDGGHYGAVNWVEPQRSSVGEMVFEYFTAVGFPLSVDVATQLYTAILTDTGRFRFQSTSARTMQVAGHLIAAGADPKKICDEIYFNLEPSTMILTARVLNSVEFHHHGSVCILTLTHDMLAEAEADPSESDGLVDFTLFTNGVVVGALLKEHGEHSTRVSLRSRDGINVAELAARYEGGGHYNAAGCTIGKDIDQAKAELLRLLEEVQNV